MATPFTNPSGCVLVFAGLLIRSIPIAKCIMSCAGVSSFIADSISGDSHTVQSSVQISDEHEQPSQGSKSVSVSDAESEDLLPLTQLLAKRLSQGTPVTARKLRLASRKQDARYSSLPAIPVRCSREQRQGYSAEQTIDGEQKLAPVTLSAQKAARRQVLSDSSTDDDPPAADLHLNSLNAKQQQETQSVPQAVAGILETEDAAHMTQPGSSTPRVTQPESNILPTHQLDIDSPHLAGSTSPSAHRKVLPRSRAKHGTDDSYSLRKPKQVASSAAERLRQHQQRMSQCGKAQSRIDEDSESEQHNSDQAEADVTADDSDADAAKRMLQLSSSDGDSHADDPTGQHAATAGSPGGSQPGSDELSDQGDDLRGFIVDDEQPTVSQQAAGKR